MKLRYIILLLIVLLSMIFHFLLLGIIIPMKTPHDIHFEYTYNWQLTGTGGDYYNYNEEFKSIGKYYVDATGNTGAATGYLDWQWSAHYFGDLTDSDAKDETYLFSYSLFNGSYLTGGDQDYNTAGMNVWFHIPHLSRSSIWILDTQYANNGYKPFIKDSIAPLEAIWLHAEGTYFRTAAANDPYGDFTCHFVSDYYFTPQGYLLAEIYHETATGYDKVTMGYSEFKRESQVIVNSASYARNFDLLFYFTFYWGPLLVVLVPCLYYSYLETKPRHVLNEKFPLQGRITIQYGLPPGKPYAIDSPFAKLIPDYIIRTQKLGGKIISASGNEAVYGIGIRDPIENIASFFGTPQDQMISFSRVNFAFKEGASQNVNVAGRLMPVIEKFNVYRLDNLMTKDFGYNTNITRQATPEYLSAIQRMISFEDYGSYIIQKKELKWIATALENDVVLLAIVSPNEPWVAKVLDDIRRMGSPSPVRVANGDLLVGVAFLTVGENLGWLYGLYVHPAFRNRSIGRNLVLARLSILKMLGINSAITEIADWNTPMQTVYTKLTAQKVSEMTLIGKKLPSVKVRRH